jgi:hypothetical protein
MKLYIIKKVILANNIQEAIEKDKSKEIDEIYQEDGFFKGRVERILEKLDKEEDKESKLGF